MPTVLEGKETASSKRYSLVYYATHVGENSLPYMKRSFISFSFGGKKIEDFDLIATISGDRINHSAYAPFEDTVTSYDRLDGLYYWSTHYLTNELDFVLSTDGIELKLLDDFLHWFRAGDTKELILAEHPNRAIMARVSQPPEINLLPFEHDTEIVISGVTYKIKTTLYKGDINLSFVMDEPHWYSIVNILGKKVTEDGRTHYVDVWDDVTTGQEISLFASLDALKILYEDGIPLGSMINYNMLLGNGAYANVENLVTSLTWSKLESSSTFSSGKGARINGTITTLTSGGYPAGDYVGIIAGAIVDANDNGITSLAKNIAGYFYYSGTAPAPVILSFTTVPALMAKANNYYISSPKNSYADENNPYNEITIESLHKLTVKITTPNFFTSYNKTLKIFRDYVNGQHSWEEVRAKIRDEVRHQEVRRWAMKCIESKSGTNLTAIAPTSSRDSLLLRMSYLLKDTDKTLYPVHFTFNSQTGEAIGEFTYRDASLLDVSNLTADNDWISAGINSTKRVENVGDMLQSNYLIILDRNYPHDGKIDRWLSTNDTTKQYSHKITHDIEKGVTNLQILYKNMYL